MKKLISISIFFLAGIAVQAQDSHYSQFYATQTYMNPAFAGGSIQHRMSAAYRNQWPNIPGSFQNYSFSYDRYAPNLNSGFGFLATRDQAGSGALSNTTASLLYAYEARLARGWFFRPALQFSYNHRGINFGNLIFGDQLIRDDDVSLEEGIGNPVNYFDLGGGFLITSKRLWFGGAIHHINQPNESLYGDVFAYNLRKYSVHGGYRVKFDSRFSKVKSSALFAFNFKKQADFAQLDVGAYYELNPFVAGIWYRGLPTKSNRYGYANHDAVILIVGWYDGPYKFGYSYDVTISQLGVGATGGSHEITLTYEWADKRNKRLAKRRIIPCAKF